MPSRVVSHCPAKNESFEALRASERERQTRFESISSALQSSSFPLNRNVLRSLAPLTGTELLTTTNDGMILESTLSSEIGLLASSISSMSMQLQQLWRALHQREGERLLH